MTQTSEHVTGTAQIAIFGQGITYCAVCASRAASREVVETEVMRLNGGAVRWRALTGPMLDGKPNPRSCPHDDHRQHWLVVRCNDA
jgi:hypothetical protein